MTEVEKIPVNAQQNTKPSPNKKHKYVEKGKDYVEKQKKQEAPKENIKHEKKPRKERKNDDQYNYDASLITETTEIPKPPKKNELLNKPDQKQYKEKEGEIIDKIKAAKEKRSKILNEKFEREKKNAKGEPVEKNIFTQFDIHKEQAHKLREEFFGVLPQVKTRTLKLQKLFNELKEVSDKIQEIIKAQEGDTTENLHEKLSKMQHRLLTETLNIREQKFLQQEIQSLKRTIHSSPSVENLEQQLTKLKQRKVEIKKDIDDLKQQKNKFQAQLNKIKPKMDAQNQKVMKLKQEITKLKEEKKLQNTEFSSEREEFYQKKNKKKESIDNEIQKLRNSIDALWDEYNQKYNAYSKQQRYINYLEWQTRQKARIIKNKQFQERRRQYEERQKERQERQTIKVKKFDLQIKNCAFLIDYCLRLRPEEVKQEVKVIQKISAEQLNTKLGTDNQWKKEKGVTLIQSKKDRDLDLVVVTKKNKKAKKQEVVDKAEKVQKVQKAKTITLDLQIINSFDTVKVLPPRTLDELEKTITELRQKSAFYTKLSEQENSKKEQKIELKIENQEKQASKTNIKKEDQFPQI